MKKNPGDTAYVYRDAYFDIFVDWFWPGEGSDADRQEATDWLSKFFKLQMKYLISGVITTIRITQIRSTKIGRKVTLGQTTKNSRRSNYVGILRICSGTNWASSYQIDPENCLRHESSIDTSHPGNQFYWDKDNSFKLLSVTIYYFVTRRVTHS